MASSDPLGDMIAMIKNANTRGLRKIELPHSRTREGVAQVLRSEGYVEDVRVTEAEVRGLKRKTLHVFLKRTPEGGGVLTEIVRVSKPGRRIYRSMRRLGKVMDGLGIWVLSTSQGILSDRQARVKRTGGEVLCKVW
jgi:small subunit ribosomal protein S8